MPHFQKYVGHGYADPVQLGYRVHIYGCLYPCRCRRTYRIFCRDGTGARVCTDTQVVGVGSHLDGVQLSIGDTESDLMSSALSGGFRGTSRCLVGFHVAKIYSQVRRL